MLLGRISDFKRLNKLYAWYAFSHEQALDTQMYVLTSQFLISRLPGERRTVQAYRNGSRCYRLCVKWCALSAVRSEHATWIICPSIYSQHRHQYRVLNKYCFLSHRHQIFMTQFSYCFKWKKSLFMSLRQRPWHGVEDLGTAVQFLAGKLFFLSLNHPDLFWGPLSFLFNRCQRKYSLGKVAGK